MNIRVGRNPFKRQKTVEYFPFTYDCGIHFTAFDKIFSTVCSLNTG